MEERDGREGGLERGMEEKREGQREKNNPMQSNSSVTVEEHTEALLDARLK